MQKKSKQYSHVPANGESKSSYRVLTIPNLICLVRILLITPFVEFFLDGKYNYAALVIIASGLSDCFDGFIARRFNQESELGKILDPLADKLTVLAVGVCLAVIQPLFLPILIILLIKDIFMLIGSTKVLKMGILVPKSKWYGKLGTVMFYVTVSFIVFNEIMQNSADPLIEISPQTGLAISMVMLGITALVMIFAFIKYTFMFKEIMTQSKSSNTCEPIASVTDVNRD